MADAPDFDVAIVGGGIAGPAMACALADTGWRVLLVERSEAPPDTARGDHLQPRSCEWLAAWGVLEALFERGAEKRLGSRYLSPTGELVLHAPVDGLDVPYPFYVYLNHELISEALLARAADNPHFEVWRPAIARPAWGADGMVLDVERGQASRRVRARLVVAADGRASRLRRAAGIAADSYAYRNPMLTFFAPRTLEDPRNEVRAYFSAGGVLSVIPRTGGQWKLGFPVAAEELPRWKQAAPEELGRKIADWVPELDGICPRVCGVYPITRANADHWSRKNLVLLGDACHTLHPGRSQGMNVALRAVQALVVRLKAAGGIPEGRALEALLRAFETELKPSMDRRLADNHERGLEMDRLDPAQLAQMQRGLAAVAADPGRHAAYCRAAAGY